VRNRTLTLALLAGSFLAAPAIGMAQDLITGDTVGKPDAPNKLVFRLTNDGPTSTDPVWAEGYQKLFGEFIQRHPGWRIDLERMSDNIGQEQARMLEQVKSGQGPDCAAVDSFVLALFKGANVLKPLDEYFTKEEVADLFPFIREGITGPDGKIYAWWWNTDLRVLYRNKEIVPNAPDLGRAEGRSHRLQGKGRRRRAVQWRPLGRHDLRLARQFLGAGRQARR
jgi:multiple sugar transport system substrate-binding protein